MSNLSIVGTGLVGSAAILALSKLPNTIITAYEKSPASREAGAWISLTPTGLKVLNRLVPASEINEFVYRSPNQAEYITRFWKTGQVIARRISSEYLHTDYTQARTHRQPLLAVLVRHFPPGVVEYGRRVVDIHVDDKAKLQFDDGSRVGGFDLVVAADGIYSTVRRKYWPASEVRYKGAVAYRVLFPKTKLAGIEGLHEDTSAWRRDGEIVFLSELGLGVYGIVIIKGESPEYASTLRWERSVGQQGLERLRRHFLTWDPVISRILDVVDDIQAYPLESGAWLSNLTQDRVAFVGDAAHPTAGAYGVGAAMGFGDAWTLYRALENTRIRGVFDVPAALRIYQEARAPFLLRVERQMEVDIGDAKYVAGAATDEEWIQRFQERNVENQWLTEHDVELEVQKVIMERNWVR